MNAYLQGTCVLGAHYALGDMGTGGAPSVVTDEEYGPLSPEQLSRVGRPLTAAEQKAVNDWIAENLKKQEAAKKTAAKKTASPSAPWGFPQAPAVVPKIEAGWWGQPLWDGAPVKRWQGAIAGGGGALIVIGFLMMRR